MKHIYHFTLFLLLVILSITEINASQEIVRVIKIQDGDTITVLNQNNQTQKVRLYCIDAPELSQKFGQESKQYLVDKLLNQLVELTTINIDQYNRYVGIININNKNINLELVDKGRAWVYTEYCRIDKYNYINAQFNAKTNKIGLWAYPDPVYPSIYRKVKKTISSHYNCYDLKSCDDAYRLLQLGYLNLDANDNGIPCETLCKP
jgi:micrococcal nuclease